MRRLFASLALAAGMATAASAMLVAAPTTAPADGQILVGPFARMVAPGGWNWMSVPSGPTIAASPNVPTGFFSFEDVKLTDDMANCFDLSRAQEERSRDMRADFLNNSFVRLAAELGAVTDTEAKEPSFVEWRHIGGEMAVVSVIPSLGEADVEFTGVVYMETETASLHFVCKAVLAKGKGAYGKRPAMKAFQSMLNSFMPL